MALHKWSKELVCVKCGLIKLVDKREKFIITRYVDSDTGEMFLKAPDCSERLIEKVKKLTQLKIFL